MSRQSDESDEDARRETNHLPSHKKGKFVMYKEKHMFKKAKVSKPRDTKKNLVDGLKEMHSNQNNLEVKLNKEHV